MILHRVHLLVSIFSHAQNSFIKLLTGKDKVFWGKTKEQLKQLHRLKSTGTYRTHVCSTAKICHRSYPRRNLHVQCEELAIFNTSVRRLHSS